MKNLLLGTALLMFSSSLSGGATDGHAISVANAATVHQARYMTVFGETLPPFGYVDFCHRYPRACQPSGPIVDRVQLTAKLWSQLVHVNDFVNETIKPETDLQLYGKVEYWNYPTTAGDCEDYVLLKRKLLIQDGWPESTLLITVVLDENRQGHAVLTVRTGDGDLILDNKRANIVSWRQTPYIYVKRQSEQNPLVWISLVPPDQQPQTPISASQSN
jgi:predicted transglutaminase-like cysteine proteinase